MEDRAGRSSHRAGDRNHRMPPAAGNQQVEHDRTPLILLHLDELARQTPDQSPSDPRDNLSHHDHHRTDSPRRTRRTRIPHRNQDPRHADESPRIQRDTPPARLAPRLELHAETRHARTSINYFIAIPKSQETAFRLLEAPKPVAPAPSPATSPTAEAVREDEPRSAPQRRSRWRRWLGG